MVSYAIWIVLLGFATGFLFYEAIRKYISRKKLANETCEDGVYYVMNNQVYDST